MDRQVKEQLARVAELKRRIRAARVEQDKLRNRLRIVQSENRGLREQVNMIVLQEFTGME